MISSLNHLLPFYQEAPQISDYFWVAMVTIFVIALVRLTLHYLTGFRPARRFIERQIKGQEADTLAERRHELFDQAQRKLESWWGRRGAELWLEFDESLVTSPKRDKLYNTLDAEHFFNGQSLAAGVTSNRLLAAVPSFLTAIGVLGTFIGLTLGLRELQISADDVDTLRAGISAMINGAAIAFMTSVWGVLFSLLLNLIEKLVERRALTKIYALQHTVDRLYPRLPAESSLIEIAYSSQEASSALQELHERIGDRLQETISGMSDSMQQAMTDALNNIMGPAVQSMVENSRDQSSQALGGLVDTFVDSLQSAGQAQGEQLSSAAKEVGQAVSSMSTQMEQLFSRLNEQQHSNQILMSDSTQQFASQLAQQRDDDERRRAAIELRFSELMEKLDERLSQQFAGAADNDAKRHAQFEFLMASLMEQQQSTLSREAENAERRERQQAEKMEAQFSAQTDASNAREQVMQQRFQQQLETLVSEQQQLMKTVSDGMLQVQHQMMELTERHQHLTQSLGGVAEGAERSSQNMQNSANQLGLLSSNLVKASDVLDHRVTETTDQLGRMAELGEQMTQQLIQHTRQLPQLNESMATTTRDLSAAAQAARQGFETLGEHQETFLKGVGREFSQLGEELKVNVENIESQAEKWLREYSQTVREQVGHRMEQWNDNTRQFADQMLNTVNAISGIVDDLEKR